MCIVVKHFVLKLRDQRSQKFIKTLNKVLRHYHIHDLGLYRLLQEKGYQFQHGLPNEKDIEPYSICRMDNLLAESESSKEVTNMCTQVAHRKPCFIMLIVQNLSPRERNQEREV